MCWAALDRALRLAPRLRAERRAERWRTVRDQIRETILQWSWSTRAGAFTQALGSDELDASVLVLPLVARRGPAGAVPERAPGPTRAFGAQQSTPLANGVWLLGMGLSMVAD